MACSCRVHALTMLGSPFSLRLSHALFHPEPLKNASLFADQALCLTSSGGLSSASQPWRKILIFVLLCRPDTEAHTLKSWPA